VLIVPLRGRGVAKRIPLAVILLILANVAVFLMQHGDARKLAEAQAFYRQSALWQIEPPLYLRWLQDHPPPQRDLQELRNLDPARLTDAQRSVLAMVLQTDGPFLDALQGGRLFAPGEPGSAQARLWQPARDEYVARLRRSVVHAGAFVPREHRWFTPATSMFLHGDPMHLVGNMVFLWLAGALLEALIGFRRFLGVYLATGLLSCGLSWAFSPGSAILHLGASGAVSGVMGALASAYGTRRIPCLFSIGLFAWRGHMQGFWLAGVWVAWEGVQWVLWPSNVDRAAHIGGLLAGAVAGWFLGRRDEVARQTDEARPDPAQHLRERARRLAGEANFESAARAMLSVVAKHSPSADDWSLLWAYGRHVLHTPVGAELQRAILEARSQQPDVRQTLLALQAQLRGRRPRTEEPPR
jgi:membrane associated rhomboid family serine protease